MGGEVLYAPFLDHIRWTTVATALVILGVVTWRTRRPWLAVIAMVAWASLYELIWVAVDLAHQDPNQSLNNLLWEMTAIGFAPLLARYLGLQLWLPAYIVFAAAFVAWDVSGFRWNIPGQRAPLMVWPEILNIVTNTALAVAYLGGALQVKAARPGWLAALLEPLRYSAQVRNRTLD